MTTLQPTEMIHNLLRTYMKSSSPKPPSAFLPMSKGTIRYIEHDPLLRREKFDGCRWRLVCTWTGTICSNYASTRNLCPRHNAEFQNKPYHKRKRTVIESNSSLPNLPPPQRSSNDDDDIEFIAEIPPNPSVGAPPRKVIKVEDQNEAPCTFDPPQGRHSPIERASVNNPPLQPMGDIEFLGSKTRLLTINVIESIKRQIPPLTEFEEEYLSTFMIQTLPSTSSLIDAQLYLHEEAIRLILKNYRLKMDTIAPDYFYDFLLRHPRVPLHFKHWFGTCKPIIPCTGSSIDTKFWTLSMMIRGNQALEQPEETT